MGCKAWLTRMRRAKWKLSGVSEFTGWIYYIKGWQFQILQHSTSLAAPFNILTLILLLGSRTRVTFIPHLGAGGWDERPPHPSFSPGSSWGQRTGGSGHRQPHLWAPAWRRWLSPWRWVGPSLYAGPAPSVSYWAAAQRCTCQELALLRSLSGRPSLSCNGAVSFWLAALYSKMTSSHHILRWALGPKVAPENWSRPVPVVDRGKD